MKTPSAYRQPSAISSTSTSWPCTANLTAVASRLCLHLLFLFAFADH
ncbi:MAG: hypothetical protein R2795_19950 [Saprospiraceae bacterium]